MSFLAGRFTRRLIVLATVPCLLALVGCGSKKEVFATGSVKGKVTFNGSALPAGCTIIFKHQEKSFPATGQIGSDGSYTAQFNGKPQIPVGTYDVTIAPPQDTAGPAPDPSNPEAYKAVMMGGEGAARLPVNREVFPAKYQDAAKSLLTCTVVEGQEIVFDVDMKSGG